MRSRALICSTVLLLLLLRWIGGFKLPALSWRHAAVSDTEQTEHRAAPRAARIEDRRGRRRRERRPLLLLFLAVIFIISGGGAGVSGHGGAEARGVGTGRHHPIRRTGQSSSEHLCRSARMRSDQRSYAAAASKSERFRAPAAIHLLMMMMMILMMMMLSYLGLM